MSVMKVWDIALFIVLLAARTEGAENQFPDHVVELFKAATRPILIWTSSHELRRSCNSRPILFYPFSSAQRLRFVFKIAFLYFFIIWLLRYLARFSPSETAEREV